MAKIGNYSGNFKAVWGFSRMMIETKIPEVDKTWWGLRAYLIAEDKDRQCGNLPLLAGLLLRVN